MTDRNVPTSGTSRRWMLMGQAPGHVMYDGVFSPSLEQKPAPLK